MASTRTVDALGEDVEVDEAGIGGEAGRSEVISWVRSSDSVFFPIWERLLGSGAKSGDVGLVAPSNAMRTERREVPYHFELTRESSSRWGGKGEFRKSWRGSRRSDGKGRSKGT